MAIIKAEIKRLLIHTYMTRASSNFSKVLRNNKYIEDFRLNNTSNVPFYIRSIGVLF